MIFHNAESLLKLECAGFRTFLANFQMRLWDTNPYIFALPNAGFVE